MTKACVLIFVVALSARAVWGVGSLAFADDPTALQFPDERQYWLMASGLRAGDGLQDEFGFRAMRMPLYPAVLSLAAGMDNGIVFAKIGHWLIGALTAALTVGMAGRLFNPRVGVVAGMFVALDPFLIFFSSLLLTETLFTAALVALWWGASVLIGGSTTRNLARRWCLIGALSVVCIYARESSLGLVVVLVAMLAACRGFDRWTILGPGIVASIVVLALIPWGIRNYQVTGDWCWLTQRGGVSLYDGVGPQADGSSDLFEIQSAFLDRGPTSRDEAEWNTFLMGESRREIMADPGRILSLAATKLSRMWSLVPNAASHQSTLTKYVSMSWTVPTFLLAVAGMLILPKIEVGNGVRTVLFLLMPAIYFSAVHALFVGSVRYRIPVVPMLETLSAVAAVAIFDRLRSRHPARNPGDR